MDFAEIYAAYFDDVFFFLLGIAKNKEVAAEITSETFFKALRSIGQFRGDGNIKHWLFSIAKNSYFSYIKKQGKALSLESIADIPDPDTPEEKFLRKDKMLQLHCILHSLEEPYKEIFMLRVFGELSFKNIGNIFQKSENWACVCFYRARKKILSRWEEWNHE